MSLRQTGLLLGIAPISVEWFCQKLDNGIPYTFRYASARLIFYYAIRVRRNSLLGMAKCLKAVAILSRLFNAPVLIRELVIQELEVLVDAVYVLTLRMNKYETLD